MKNRKRFKIDYLIVFFLLSLVTLYSFVCDINYFFPHKQEQSFRNPTFKSFIETKYVFYYPKQGLVNKDEKLVNYNPEYNLLYSVDGGKSYKSYENQFVLELVPKNLKNNLTSIRSKASFGKMPELISILVKAVHKNGTIFTKPIHLTYFAADISNLPIVNLIVNEDDLFDVSKGVMNLGEQSWDDEGFYKKQWDRNANFKKRGVVSKKKAVFQIFNDNKIEYQTDCIFQISGNATRSFPQKSIKLKSIQNNKFEQPFFKKKGLKKYKSIVLRQSGNDNKKTLFADLLMQNLAAKLPVLTQKGFPINIFINGNYWGIYNLRERYDTYFIGKSESVNSKKITILEGGNGKLKKGKKEIRNNFISLIDLISNQTTTNDEMVEYLKTKINISSFTYYILLETYYGNGDWLNNNVMWYKAENGKWKWLLNDLDYSLTYNGFENINSNYFKFLKKSNSITAKLFNSLINNEGYKNYFKHTSYLFLQTYLTNSRINEDFAKLKNEIEPNIEFQMNRWRGNFTKLEWEENCKMNLDFLLNRKEVFLKQVNEL